MFAKKSFGQHFLHDKSVIKKIITAAEITPRETILEIGPGHGILTQALVDAGASVIAIEADRDLIPDLKEKFGNRAHLLFGDVLKFSTAKLLNYPIIKLPNYKLVSNLPYNIASAVLEKFLADEHSPTRMVVMVQREVADRILAKPGDMSVLSVACQLYADVKRVCNVFPGAFHPMPKVDSTVVQLDRSLRMDKRSVTNRNNVEQVIQLAKLGFVSRRKQLQGNLGKKYGTERVKMTLCDIGLNDKARAQELSVDQWIELWERLVDSRLSI
ncbi:MAG: 16S rRNA (adenine(1518)-N(6)/adenine(1519)-N(6))-dimethyltransferase RsmA [Patescibacteria group bacterium]